MALTKKIQTADNFGRLAEFESAYIKVAYINGNKDTIVANVCIYATDPKTSSVQVVKNEQHSFVPNMTGENFIAQAYNHLKTLPDFAGAFNC